MTDTPNPSPTAERIAELEAEQAAVERQWRPKPEEGGHG